LNAPSIKPLRIVGFLVHIHDEMWPWFSPSELKPGAMFRDFPALRAYLQFGSWWYAKEPCVATKLRMKLLIGRNQAALQRHKFSKLFSL
jgi:hypothetical protein